MKKEEFSRIYNEQIQPALKELEQYRKIMNKKIKPGYFWQYLLVVLTIVVLVWPIENQLLEFGKLLLFTICMVSVSILGVNILKLKEKVRKRLKKEILVKILSLYNLILDSHYLISSEEIRDMGLFPTFSSKLDDDIFTGVYKGCEIIINECSLVKDNSSHDICFYGLIVKAQMNKVFSGRTIVGRRGFINSMDNYEEVQLEDIEYMSDMQVYSTNQIEARYILTPAFIERLRLLGQVFYAGRNKNRIYQDKNKVFEFIFNLIAKFPGITESALKSMRVKAAFIDGFVFLFIPTGEDFFEVDINSSLFNEDKYFDIYNQIQSILQIIDYLKLNLKLGL